MTSPISKLVNIVIVALIIGAGVYFFAPGLWTEAEQAYREKAGWTEEAKRAQPVRYLEYTLEQARREHGKIDSYIAEYQSNIRSLTRQRDEAVKTAGFDDVLLNEMKGVYKQVETGATNWPVTFREGAYTEQQFMTQLETLLNEKKTHEVVAKKLTVQIQKLIDKLGEIRKARTEYGARITAMEADLAIARANVGTADINRIIEQADDVMAYVGATADSFSTPIRSTKDLMNEMPSSDAVDADVKAFLES
jgi:hypothetical protein